MSFVDHCLDAWFELSPWLILGTLISGMVHIWLPRNWLSRQFRGIKGVAKAVFVGVPLPLCSCAVIPAGLGLHKDGASKGATVGFLISTPQTGVDSVLVAASFLGWPFALLKVAAALVMGLLGGSLAEIATPAAPANLVSDQSPEVAMSRRWAFVMHVWELIYAIRYWLIVGVLISAAISTWLPQMFATNQVTESPVIALFTALGISIPLYVCATASVPIAAALVQSGLSSGAALVFLMAGPATNLATLGAVYRTLGARSLLIYLVSIISGSLFCGLIFDHWINLNAVAVLGHQHGNHWWHIAAGIALAAMVLLAIASDARRKLRKEVTVVDQRISVSGMSCDGCAMNLETVLKQQPGIQEVQVSFADQCATVRGEISTKDLSKAIHAAGFRTADYTANITSP